MTEFELWATSELMEGDSDPQLLGAARYKPTPEEVAEMEAEVATWTEARNNPPCQECGAMTIEEAETKCRCGGDKDHCHGVELWPDDEVPNAKIQEKLK